MPKVVVRGEVVYECDVCSRKIRVPSNKEGIDVLQRCIITHGCRGSLRQLTQAKDINSTPAFPPEVQGVQDWFQRRVFYEHTQALDSDTWIVEHNLANRPIIHAFIKGLQGNDEVLIRTDDFTTESIDLNTTRVKFPQTTSGLAHAVSLSSQNASNPEISPVVDASAFQVTTNLGEIAFAVRDTVNGWNCDALEIYVTFNTPTPLAVTYTNIDNTPPVSSPWVGSQRVIANGKMYSIRSLNVVNSNTANQAFAANLIPNGTTFKVTGVAGRSGQVSTSPGDVIVLLGKSPFAAVDRISDQYIDAGRPEAIFTYDTGIAYIDRARIKNTYPPIAVVDPVQYPSVEI